MTTETVDRKVVDRIRKLLNLAAESSGATQAEAELAAERAREMMAAFGLSTAEVEARGGQGEARADAALEGLAGEWWQPPLMNALAETCFVWIERSYSRDAARRKMGAGYRLIGRESAVATVRVTFEYLCQTARRACREEKPEKRKHFLRGMSERLVERIERRHREEMLKQEREAKAQHAATPSNGRALVVTLVDYAQREKDLNKDLRRGLALGTTGAKREKETRELEECRQRRQAKREQLLAEGIPPDVADYMIYGYNREEAEKLCQPAKADDPKAEERQRRRDERDQKRWNREYYRQASIRESSSWQAGRRRGDEVSLDKQVAQSEQKKLE